MTNVPGVGFIIILAGSLSLIPINFSILIGVILTRLRTDSEFIRTTLLSYLAVGIVSAIALIVVQYDNTGFFVSFLTVGVVSYLVVSIIAIVPIVLGASLSHFIHKNNWEEALYSCSAGWIVGCTISVVAAIPTNIIVVLLGPLFGLIGVFVIGVTGFILHS